MMDRILYGNYRTEKFQVWHFIQVSTFWSSLALYALLSVDNIERLLLKTAMWHVRQITTRSTKDSV